MNRLVLLSLFIYLVTGCINSQKTKGTDVVTSVCDSIASQKDTTLADGDNDIGFRELILPEIKEYSPLRYDNLIATEVKINNSWRLDDTVKIDTVGAFIVETKYENDPNWIVHQEYDNLNTYYYGAMAIIRITNINKPSQGTIVKITANKMANLIYDTFGNVPDDLKTLELTFVTVEKSESDTVNDIQFSIGMCKPDSDVGDFYTFYFNDNYNYRLEKSFLNWEDSEEDESLIDSIQTI